MSYPPKTNGGGEVDVLGTPLAGLSTSDRSEVTAADTVLSGIGKLQAQINPSSLYAVLSANQTLGDGGFLLVDYANVITATGGMEYSGGGITADRSGRILITAQVGSSDPISGLTLAVQKNGTPLAQSTAAAVGEAPFKECAITILDFCDSNDLYEIYAVPHGATDGSYTLLAQSDITFLRAAYV